MTKTDLNEYVYIYRNTNCLNIIQQLTIIIIYELI